MQSTILVPLDGSVLSEHALPYAARLAQLTSARLTLCRVLAPSKLQTGEADLGSADEAAAYMQRVANQLMTGHMFATAILWGEPAAEILKQILSTRADLVVMATHGRSGLGRWLYGSVADEVLRRASVPIVLVPPGSAEPWPNDRVPRLLVPLDGSQLGEAALGPAQELATRLGAEIVLLQVIPFPAYPLYGDGSAYIMAFDTDAEVAEAKRYLGEVARRLQCTCKQVSVRALVGHPSVAIAQVAADEKADLIVAATHGRSGLARLVLGSVAIGTLRRANVPLVLVRPAALHSTTTEVARAAEPIAEPYEAAGAMTRRRGVSELTRR
jgi:nucleotide-binding universal stress UspA family protein